MHFAVERATPKILNYIANSSLRIRVPRIIPFIRTNKNTSTLKKDGRHIPAFIDNIEMFVIRHQQGLNRTIKYSCRDYYQASHNEK